MSANPISDKELASLLRLASAAIDELDGDMELSDDCDRAAELLDARRGVGSLSLPEIVAKNIAGKGGAT